MGFLLSRLFFIITWGHHHQERFLDFGVLGNRCHLVNRQILIQQVWGRASEMAFLTNFQSLLMLLALGPLSFFFS